MTASPATATTARGPSAEVIADLRRARTRARVDLALVTLDVVAFALALAGTGGPVRFGVGVAFGLLVPGWALVGFVRLKSLPLELGLTLATSLAVVMVLAQLMMTFHLWDPEGLMVWLSAACVLPLTLLRRRDRRDAVDTARRGRR